MHIRLYIYVRLTILLSICIHIYIYTFCRNVHFSTAAFSGNSAIPTSTHRGLHSTSA